MSMYNILFGKNPFSDIILGSLGLQQNDVARFRDCFVAGDKIAIYTRLGGGNRECCCSKEGTKHYCYQEDIKKLQSHSNYLYDKDDDFDCTYATFYFSLPERHIDVLSDLASDFNPNRKWLEKIKEVENSSFDELKNKYPSLVKTVEDIIKEVKR